MEALTPGYMLEKPRGKMFSNLLNSLVDSKWLSCTKAEEAERQYRSFCIDVAAKDVTFINFQDSDRLDSLFFRHLAGRTEYFSLWSVIEMALILSHGQATVERGFSINSNTTTTNLKEHSLIAHRAIIDYVKKAGGVMNVIITKEMIMATKVARQRYHQYLEAEKEKKEKASASVKRKAVIDEVEDLKAKKRRLTDVADGLEKEAEQTEEKAASAASVQLFTKAHALRKQVKAAREELQLLTRDLDVKLQELAQ